jgi:hypothetical protein
VNVGLQVGSETAGEVGREAGLEEAAPAPGDDVDRSLDVLARRAGGKVMDRHVLSASRVQAVLTEENRSGKELRRCDTNKVMTLSTDPILRTPGLGVNVGTRVSAHPLLVLRRERR